MMELDLTIINYELTAGFSGITEGASAVISHDSRGFFLGTDVKPFYADEMMRLRFYVPMAELKNAESPMAVLMSKIRERIEPLLAIVVESNSNMQRPDLSEYPHRV